MISEKAKKWIDAGKLFAVDSTATTICPECETNKLRAKDTVSEKNPYEIEREIFCSNCGAKNYLRLKKNVIN
jgi:ribosomal protein L40E